jgi:FkbM family methyltransferase
VTPSAEVFMHPVAGIWWPVADGNPITAWQWVEPRIKDSDRAVGLCRKRRTCVQAGGYVGVWPIRLARSFARVLTFEPMPGCFEACRRNCEGLPNVAVSMSGLGSSAATVPLRPHGTAGSWRIDPEGTETASLITIDSLGLDDCDAIILDVEGYETEALKGAAETIARCRPVIQVEELERSAPEIRSHLNAIGYRLAARVRKDGVYVPG